VFAQNPAGGASVAPGSNVALSVSLGPAAPAVCTAAPIAPTGLTVTVVGRTVTTNWTAPAGPVQNAPTSYVLEAGLTATTTFLSLNTGSAATTFQQVSNNAGTFFVRVRGVNNCGTGPVSNTVQVVVQ
jgi:hypothetical protein